MLQLTNLDDVFSSASKNQFKPGYILEDLVQAMCNSQALKNQLNDDPSWRNDSGDSGFAKIDFMSESTAKSLINHIGISLEKICTDISDSFRSRKP